ncbi:hypothetical protein MTP06_16850 [Streptomyces sp. PLM4]|nr:hypothetical protein MTP06_16850 [Streptomyces sp. PLM4]
MHPCIATTSGRPAGSPSGTYRNIRRFPGLLPNPVTSVSEAARADAVTDSGPATPARVTSNAPTAAPANTLRRRPGPRPAPRTRARSNDTLIATPSAHPRNPAPAGYWPGTLGRTKPPPARADTP